MSKNRCNCPNCASNNCPNADDTRLHGAAVALMGLLDAFEHDGGDVEELLFLAKTWREQEAIKREQNQKAHVARVNERPVSPVVLPLDSDNKSERK